MTAYYTRDLTDLQWEALESYFAPPPPRPDGKGRPWTDTRAVLNGLLYVLRTGCAWRDLPRLRKPQAFGAWFRQHVVRSAWKAARRQRSQVRLPDRWIDPIDHLERALASHQLQRAFEALEADDRVVLTLHYHLGLTNDETSRLLKVPVGTVKSRLHYALRRLRAAYDAEERT